METKQAAAQTSPAAAARTSTCQGGAAQNAARIREQLGWHLIPGNSGTAWRG